MAEQKTKKRISEIKHFTLSYAVYEAVKKYFEDPENERKFQEWKKARELKV